jgi:hypothetical protein
MASPLLLRVLRAALVLLAIICIVFLWNNPRQPADHQLEPKLSNPKTLVTAAAPDARMAQTPASDTRHVKAVSPTKGMRSELCHPQQKSLRDTKGFICETDEGWSIRKAALLRQAGMVVLTSAASKSCASYLQTNFEPSLSCAFEQRLGEFFSLD